ncbi:MAG TPA: acyl-CoA dehydrogenase family protein [Burkholderiales bacterium]|nr:acyl-CoA dehydrogenase family protein [Burkholderiales bacterium]
MYNLHLTAEQLEFRDTVRDFVEREIRPAALHPDRLQPFDKPLLKELLDRASQMGLRTLALPEEAGGAGADTLTTCIVLEELAAGDVDIAMALGQTAVLARELFGAAGKQPAIERLLAGFIEDDAQHLALASVAGDAVGWSYHRPAAGDDTAALTAVEQGNEWVLNGTLPYVANAPIAKLIIVRARTGANKGGPQGMSALLVPRDATGITVHEVIRAIGGSAAGGQPGIRWHHGPGAALSFRDCKVPAGLVVARDGHGLAAGVSPARSDPAFAAINLGVGRAAYDAAVEYARIRRQGGRNIIEHQAIGGKLAECAMKLELARTMIWKAAWAADHPEAVADRSLSALPLHTIARVYTAEAMNEVALYAAECFGAMGVMRDMPLQKYVHDTMVFLHSEDTDTASKLQIAEAVAGYRRPVAA